MDHTTIYSIVMEFKDTLARIFLEKGLVWESYQLADFKAVAVEQQSRRTTAHAQHLSLEVMHMLKVIAEVVYAVVMNRIKTQKAVTINKYSQTDVSSSVGKSTPPIKKEQHMHEQTDLEGDATPTPTVANSANTTITPTTPSDVHHPALRRSSRSSVLNRKPIIKTVPRTKAKKADSLSKVVKVASDSDNTMMTAESGEGGEVKVWGEGALSAEKAGSEGGGGEHTAGSRFVGGQCGEQGKRRPACHHQQQNHQATRQTLQCSKPLRDSGDLQQQTDSHPQETLTTKAADDGEMSDFEPVGYMEQAKHSPKEEDPLLSDSESNNLLSAGGDDAEEVKKEEEDRQQQQQTGQKSAPTEEAGSMGALYEVRGSGCYRCTVCGQETRDRSNMRKHVLRWHAGEQRHPCPLCSKAFSYPESLKFHMKVHVDPASRAFERTSQGLYRCRQCGRECRNRSNIVKHVNRKHLKAGEKPYQCSLCLATFGYLRSLKRHELVHEGVRPYQCAQCHKRFFDPTSLRIHSRVHTDDRPYACQLCGNRFRQKEGLKGHMRSHTGDKPYVCDRCGMAFAAKRSLTRHIRVHTGERPYSCDQCVAAFADWTTLHNHKLIHRDPTHDTDHSDTTPTADPQRTLSENKPYQCQFCGVQYGNTLTLKRHLRVHTTPSQISKRSPRKPSKTLDGTTGMPGESPALHLQYRPYMCEFCGDRFKHLRGYTTHKQKHLNGTLLVRKTASGNQAPVDRAGQGERQLSQDRTCVVSGRGAGLTSVDTPLSAFQPQLPPPPPAVINDVAVFETTLNNFPTPMHTVQIPVTDPSEVGHPGSLIHYASEGMTQVIQYEDGSLGQLTTLVPHPPPPPPPPSSSLLQPVQDLLDGVVTVVFESADGNVVLESGQ